MTASYQAITGRSGRHGATRRAFLAIRGFEALEKRRDCRLHAAQFIVIEFHATDAALSGKNFGLRLEFLRREHTGDACVDGLEATQISGELLDAVDLTASLDLDGDVRTVGVPAQQVDGADVGGVLALDQCPAVAEHVALL